MIGSIKDALLAAALCGAVAAAGWGWWQSGRADRAEVQAASLARSVAVLRASVEQRADAARIAAERAAVWEARAGDLDTAIQSILTADLGECADAQLDPYLSDLLGRLRSDD